MARYLYLDNFRGFKETYIPIADVNFLVGENSSGKTSVLELMKIVSNPHYFLGSSLMGGEEVQLGHFKEVVSAHSKDQSYFRFGVISATGDEPSGFLATYVKNEEGLPQLSQATYAFKDVAIHVRYGDEILTRTEVTSFPADSLEPMTAWISSHAETGAGWAALELPEGFPISGRSMPLFMLINFALHAGNTKKNIPLVLPNFVPQLIWLAPIRTKPSSIYYAPNPSFSPEGAHTPYVIRRMLSSVKQKAQFDEFTGRIGRTSGLFEKIEIRKHGDAGDPVAPFEVDAVLDGEPLNLSWVGYGVSQSLPILVELLDRPKGSWFAIQQPEVHLHPRAQASLGDVFFDMAVRDDKRFLIETHSDFMIDRFRMNYRRKDKKIRNKLPQSQVLFFERQKKHNAVFPVPIEPNGEFSASQPASYRQFFIREQMKVLGL